MVMDYEGFKMEVNTLTGINLSLYKEKQMKRRIEALINKNEFDNFKAYLEELKLKKALYFEFINYLTINVSQFFRNPDQWKVLQEEILPMLFQKNKNLKIWSSACSTGDEPYTLVMVLNKYLPLSDIKIIATDIDKGALEKAEAGIYNYKSVEDLPKEYLNKYFDFNEAVYKIKDEVKKCVEFRQLNLLKEVFPSKCDLIVCRNVLIYFTEEAKTEIYKKFNEALKDQSILFVGSTEQIIQSNKFNFKSVRTFFYFKEGNYKE